MEVVGDVRGLMVQARRAAQKRAQPLCTGHMLLASLQSAESGRLLESHGLREVALVRVLKTPPPEAANAVELCLERGRRLAEQSGARQLHPLHVLSALLRDGRNAASGCLSQLGVNVGALCRVLDDSLGTPSPSGPAASRVRRDQSRTSAPSHARYTQAATERESPGQSAPRPLPPTLMDWEAHRRAAHTDAAADISGSAAPAEVGSAARTSGRLGRAPGSRHSKPPSHTSKSGAAAQGQDGSRGLEASSGARTRSAGAEGEAPATRFALEAGRFPLLCTLGRNLTELSARGELDPVIGRSEEIEAVLDILARRRANNPLLVGASGVGKTAVAEGVAQRLLNEPGGPTAGRVLIELSAGALLRGTAVRGALAERLFRLRNEVAQAEGRVLLFFDEIHMLLGSGEGADDIANELKAALARGELPCLGATTDSEFRRVFERDTALVRRFTRVEVGEPSAQETLQILSGVAQRYALFHAVRYTDEALRGAVEWSARYLPERQLPEKAIGLIDLAGARARRREADEVDAFAIAEVVSEQSGVPAARMTMRDGERLLSLEVSLERRVVGQASAISRIAEALRRAAVGLRGQRPLGVFLLLGPTGVGKTELAKALSDELFPQSGMTRLDMSEYSESHAVARLFGAPPGYVGHEDGGQLTEPVRRRPYQLLLLDEAEKAHPEVLQALLALLDEGRLTDGRGRTVDFRNTVIVLTSNLGAAGGSGSRVGFASDAPGKERGADAEKRALRAVRSALPPEFFNRIDEVLYCGALSRAEVREVARRMLRQLAAVLATQQDLTLEFDDSLLDALIEAGGYDPALGARPMRRTVGRLVESRIASAVLGGDLQRGQRVRVWGSGAQVHMQTHPSEA